MRRVHIRSSTWHFLSVEVTASSVANVPHHLLSKSKKAFPTFSERVSQVPFGDGILAFQTVGDIGIKTDRIVSWESVSKLGEAQPILRPKDHSIQPRCRLVLLHNIEKLPQPLLIKGLW